ncbi:MAG: FAD-dependent thymidylate synthase [Oscillospiraceae bacterium]
MDLTDFNSSGAFIIGLSDCGEKITGAGGRVSTQEGTVLSIFAKSQDDEKNAKLIDKVTRSGHNSVVEHTYYNLAFQNVSTVCEQFIIEFRLASFTVKSRRYVNFSDAGFYIPNFDNEDMKKSYEKHMSSLFSLYTEFCENGIAKEDARFLLPYCLFSNFFCSINGREFLHLLKAMIFGRGSKFPEIKALGLELLEQAKTMTPGIMTDFEKRNEFSNHDNPDFSFLNLPKRKENGEKVELLSYTKDAAKIVCRSALVSYSNIASDDIEKIIEDKENTSKIIAEIMSCERPRPLEAASFTFRYNKVSLSGITHFARHRMQSLDVPQLTKTDRESYIIPPSLSDKPELLEKYKNAFKNNAKEYKRLKALGISEEDLVYYQLSGNTLDIVSTMNARELILFLRLRTCTRAQWEVREYAIDALQMLRKVEPQIFKFYGPSCYIDRCPEGKFSCGRMAEMKEFFSK